MTSQADLLVNSYHEWLRKHTHVKAVAGDITEFTAPFLDRHNDYFQIYAERVAADSYLLTDDGYVIGELKSSGVESRGPRRQDLIRRLLSGLGVTLEGAELRTSATSENFGQRIHNLIQAMLSIDDMHVLSQPTVEGLFAEDVARFLDARRIRYTSGVKLAGRSGFDHLIEFAIPKSEQAPERMLKLMRSPRRDRVENLLFAIADTRDARDAETEFLALIDDRKRDVPAGVIEAFERYSVTARAWSSREELLDRLAS
ncbi:DUF1828 domain-containing protein [Saccharomonospora iraqiensis]|uniref:DUF1828 domain-containing protein n=1 Tax=Saccharomonospora iraqiensis TaxID=52698 RepID=UPI00047C5FF4|nr:DUF1828 domain-containing protein [Saccharomonospora iraqiensis]